MVEAKVGVADLSDRIVIEVGTAGEVAHGDVFMGERLDSATREGACGVAV